METCSGRWKLPNALDHRSNDIFLVINPPIPKLKLVVSDLSVDQGTKHTLEVTNTSYLATNQSDVHVKTLELLTLRGTPEARIACPISVSF